MLAVAVGLELPRGSGAGEVDAGTLARCRRGDRVAFHAFVVHYQRAVHALISRIVGPGADVEDLAQETFLRAFRAFGSFDVDRKARASAWILTIATRLAIDEKRRRLPRLASEDDGAEETVDTATPETEHARRELGLAIARAGAELPPDQRAAFVLAEFHSLSIAEIASALDIPENTAKTRLFRARQHMRERLASLRREATDGAE